MKIRYSGDDEGQIYGEENKDDANGYIHSQERDDDGDGLPLYDGYYDDDDNYDPDGFRADTLRIDELVDTEGRQWRSAVELGSLRRDGLPETSSLISKDQEVPRPWYANMGKHSLMLRDTEHGTTSNLKKGRFIEDQERWLHRYEALCQYYDKYGHTNVPSNVNRTSDDASPEPWVKLNLGVWVVQQRNRYYDKSLSQKRIELLNRLGFTWNMLEARWDEKYEQLAEFFRQHGHTNVRQNTTLGHWVYKQRWYQRGIQQNRTVDLAAVVQKVLNTQNDAGENYTVDDIELFLEIDPTMGTKKFEGKPLSPLTPARRKKLEALNFSWDHYDAIWEQNFAMLEEYKRKHGTTRVPNSVPTLGRWVRKHRTEYQKTQRDEELSSAFLTPKRIERLDRIGFDWEMRTEEAWDRNFENLVLFKQEFGHLIVPQSFSTSDYPSLGSWVSNQRKAARKIKAGAKPGKRAELTEERVRMLEELGLEWDPYMPGFRIRIQELAKHKEEHGTVRVKSTHPLYSFFRSTRQEYRKLLDGKSSRINDERKRMLDDLGFDEFMANES